MVAEGSSSGEGEDLGDGAADELEWVVLKSSWNVLKSVSIVLNFVGNFIRIKKVKKNKKKLTAGSKASWELGSADNSQSGNEEDEWLRHGQSETIPDL